VRRRSAPLLGSQETLTLTCLLFFSSKGKFLDFLHCLLLYREEEIGGYSQYKRCGLMDVRVYDKVFMEGWERRVLDLI
jgi:hypothetical protein